MNNIFNDNNTLQIKNYGYYPNNDHHSIYINPILRLNYENSEKIEPNSNIIINSLINNNN